jgi:hypothetical protein
MSDNTSGVTPSPRIDPEVHAAQISAKANIVVAIIAMVSAKVGTFAVLFLGTNKADASLDKANVAAERILKEVKFPFSPTGTIQAYAGEPNTGDLKARGWLLCDGRSYPTNEFPQLFASIGYAWGQ